MGIVQQIVGQEDDIFRYHVLLKHPGNFLFVQTCLLTSPASPV